AERPPGPELLGTLEEVEVPLAARARDRNDLDAAIAGELEDQIQAGFVGEKDVGEDEVGVVRPIQLERLTSARSGHDLVPRPREDIAQDVEEITFVVDHEDAGHLVSPAAAHQVPFGSGREIAALENARRDEAVTRVATAPRLTHGPIAATCAP